MSINEVLYTLGVIFIFVIFLFVMAKLKQPWITYFRWALSLFLVSLFWLVPGQSSFTIKILLTLIILFASIKDIRDYINYLKAKKIEE